MALGGAIVKLVPLAGGSIIVLGGVVWALGYVEYRVHHRRGTGWLTRPRMVLIITAGTAVVSVVALAVALFQPGRSSL